MPHPAHRNRRRRAEPGVHRRLHRVSQLFFIGLLHLVVGLSSETAAAEPAKTPAAAPAPASAQNRRRPRIQQRELQQRETQGLGAPALGTSSRSLSNHCEENPCDAKYCIVDDRRCGSGSRWYGSTIIIIDGAAILAAIGVGAVAASGEDASPFLALSLMVLGTYTLGGPITHWHRGNLSQGFASLGMRVGMPLGGALAGVALSSNDEFGGIVSGFGGFVLGAIGAMVVDSAALAWHPEEHKGSAATSSGTRWHLIPVMNVETETAGMQLLGVW